MKYSCLKETQKAMKMSFPLVGNHSPQRCWTSQHDKEEYFQVNIRHKVSKEIQKLMFLIFFLVFHFSLFTFHFSLSYAENLSDIKLNALDKPIEEKWGRDPFIRYGDKIAKLKGKIFREDMPVGLK
ncbi:MAG: hypothetical protein NTW44_00350, partial [Nitrospirae bacterium]|nr:hypothetical protein [Nitrospirota bacterium]